MVNHSPPVPKNILRGHKAPVHAATFLRRNQRMATGDGEGYVVLWDLTIMRPRAVWRAHENSILSIKGWGHDKIITHGRDHKLIVWQLSESDEERLSVALPLEDVAVPRPLPWMLHMLEVNTMNFCNFAACGAGSEALGTEIDEASEILIAVPNTLQSEAIDIYSLPSQQRIHTIKPGKDNGMAMSIGLTNLDGTIILVATFENGYASVHRLNPDGEWIMTYRSQAHSQPILSLAIHPNNDCFITSSADSLIAKHPLPLSQEEGIATLDPENRIIEEIDDSPSTNAKPSLLSEGLKKASSKANAPKPANLKPVEKPIKVVNTKHSGQQSLEIRSDGKIFATAGWDTHLRVYSCKTLKELAVLQWHKVGCYAVAFADVDVDNQPKNNDASRNMTQDSEAHVGATSEIEANAATKQVQPIHKPTVKERRIKQATEAHWIVGGAKDGKVSVWDVY